MTRDTDERGKLLPCPFCGGTATIEEIKDGAGVRFSVGCDSADEIACMGYQNFTTFARRGEAKVAWNTRAPAGHAERWQPIADFVCGHDNPNVLVADDGVVSEAYYNSESDKWFKAGKSEHDFDFVRSDVLYPSHWMPLPAAPADTEDQGPDTLGERP